MNNLYHDDEHDSVKPIFLKGCGIIIAVIVLLIAGFLFTLGILSVTNKVSPVELLKGVGMQASQTTEIPQKPGESANTGSSSENQQRLMRQLLQDIYKHLPLFELLLQLLQ